MQMGQCKEVKVMFEAKKSWGLSNSNHSSWKLHGEHVGKYIMEKIAMEILVSCSKIQCRW